MIQWRPREQYMNVTRLRDTRSAWCPCIFALGGALWWHAAAGGQEINESDGMTGPFNLPLKTWGGLQVWTDLQHHHGWRIQQHAISKHCRLIDPRNVRRAWGSRTQCEEQLEALTAAVHEPQESNRILLLLHGLGRTRNSMQPVADVLLREQPDYRVINVSYASTRASLDDHAQALRSIIEHLPPDSQIDVVAHSMGNIVLRRYFADCNDAKRPAPPQTFHRIVMLGPPNQGAEFARKLKRTGLLGLVMGQSAKQLAELKTSDAALRLAVPPCEFGIIAGSSGALTNPLLRGENDLVVEVAETRLKGATDFWVVPVAHTILMTDESVLRATARFIEHGYFVSPQDRQPITQ